MARARAKYTIEAEDRTDRGLRSAEGRLRSFARTIAGPVAAAAAAIGAAIGAWAVALQNAIRNLDEFAKRAKDIRATLAEQSALDLFANLRGSTPQAVAGVVERIRGFAGRALLEGPTGEGRRLLGQLNLTPEGLQGLTPVELLGRFGVSLAGAPSAEIATRARREIAGDRLGRLFDPQGQFLRDLGRAFDLNIAAGRGPAAARAEAITDLRTEIGALLSRGFEDFNLGRVTDDPFSLRGVPGSALEITLTEIRDFLASLRAPTAGRGGFDLSQTRNTRALEDLTAELERNRLGGSSGGSTFQD